MEAVETHQDGEKGVALLHRKESSSEKAGESADDRQVERRIVSIIICKKLLIGLSMEVTSTKGGLARVGSSNRHSAH